ncbi:hypothetical protein HZ326_17188, partial [Fusarium oxysporum f. sp. albedinis]
LVPLPTPSPRVPTLPLSPLLPVALPPPASSPSSVPLLSSKQLRTSALHQRRMMNKYTRQPASTCPST